MESVTVYIPCYNAERFLGGCVDSLLRQTVKASEILVVNDGSTDRTAKLAGELPVRMIDLHERRGLASARNAAIHAANHDYIASIDVDCIAEPHWLERLMSNLKGDSVAGVGGRLVEKYRSRLADRWRAVHMRQNWGEKRIVNPPFLFGCNTLFKKTALESVGLYHTRFRTNGEDVDISHRLREKGYTLIYDPSAGATHLKRDSVFSVLRADWQWGYRSLNETMKYERNSHIVYHNYVNTKYRLRQDISSHRYSLLVLDLMLLFYHTYFDIRHSEKLHLKRPPLPGLSSHIETFTRFYSHLARLSRSHFLQNPDSFNEPK